MKHIFMAMVAACELCTAGCRTYAPLSLDLASFESEWHTPGVEAATLSFDETVAMTRLHHPRLQLWEPLVAGYEEAQAYAGHLEDPQLMLGFGWNLDAADDPLELGVGFRVEVPLSDRLAWQRRLAHASTQTARFGRDVVEREVVTAVREHWADYTHYSATLEVRREVLTLLERFTDQLAVLAASGEVSPLVLTRARMQVALQQDELRKDEFVLRQAELGLRMGIGAAPEDPIKFETGYLAMSAAEARAACLATDAYSEHPLMQRLWAELAQYEARLALSISEQYPQLQIGPGWDLEDGENILGVQFAWAPPLWNGNQQSITERYAEREAHALLLQTTLVELTYDSRLALSQLESAQARTDIFENGVLADAESQWHVTASLMAAGEIAPDTGLEVLEIWLETRLSWLEARHDAAMASVELFCCLPNMENIQP